MLGGLWPTRSGGVVTRPSHIGHEGLFYLPQNAYTVLGASLKQQITYPDTYTDGLTNSHLEVFKLAVSVRARFKIVVRRSSWRRSIFPIYSSWSDKERISYGIKC